MEIGVLELKQRIEGLPASSGGRRKYSPEIRELVLEYVARRKNEGASSAVACRELGVHKATIIGWAGGKGRRKKTAPSKRKKTGQAVPVRAVEVTEASGRAPVVVLPGGARVEGLTVGELAELVRALA